MEILAFLREGVLGAGRDFGIAAAGDDAVGFQVIEPLGKGAGVDGADGALQLAEAFWAAHQVAQDEGGPFVADNLHGGGDAAGFGLYDWFNRVTIHYFIKYSIGTILPYTLTIKSIA